MALCKTTHIMSRFTQRHTLSVYVVMLYVEKSSPHHWAIPLQSWRVFWDTVYYVSYPGTVIRGKNDH